MPKHEIPLDPLTRQAAKLMGKGVQRETLHPMNRRGRTKKEKLLMREAEEDDKTLASNSPQPKPLPKHLKNCQTRSQLVKWLKNKYHGWFPYRWTSEELEFYENFNKTTRKHIIIE